MRILTFIIFLLTSINSNAVSQTNLLYGMLIEKSDLIVHGKILKVTDSTYEFQVHNIIKGKSLKEITVSIWEEWICDIRSLPLESNAELVLFLTKNGNNVYDVLNGSNGELFVDDNSVITHFDNNPITVDLMIKGIQLFSKHFEYLNGECCDYQKLIFEQLTEDKELKKLMRSNIFLKAILFEINDHNKKLNN